MYLCICIYIYKCMCMCRPTKLTIRFPKPKTQKEPLHRKPFIEPLKEDPLKTRSPLQSP